MKAEGVDAEPAACLYEPNGWLVLTLRFGVKSRFLGFLEKPEGGPYVGLTPTAAIRWTGGHHPGAQGSLPQDLSRGI